MSGNEPRTARSISTSQPGRALSLMRGKPASTALLNVGEQVVEGVKYSEVGAGDHVGVGSAQEGVQGDTRAFAFEGPPEDFDGRLGEAVALEGGQAGVQFDGGVELAADDERSEDLGDEVIDGAGRLGHVVRGAEGGGLGPGCDAVGGGLDEDRVDGVVFAVGGSPGIDERHADVIDVEAVESHPALRDG